MAWKETPSNIYGIVSPQHVRTGRSELQALELWMEARTPQCSEYLLLVKNTRSCFFFRKKMAHLCYNSKSMKWYTPSYYPISHQERRTSACRQTGGGPWQTRNSFGTHYPDLPQKHTQGSVHTQPNERTVRGCKNEQHKKLSYNLAVLAKPYFCSKWSQYTRTLLLLTMWWAYEVAVKRWVLEWIQTHYHFGYSPRFIATVRDDLPWKLRRTYKRTIWPTISKKHSQRAKHSIFQFHWLRKTVRAYLKRESESP
jgi:hypothetical protein